MGQDTPDTIAAFTKDEIYFLCTKKRLSRLKNLEDSAMLAVHARVRVILKHKKESGLEKMDKILHEIRDTEKRWTADADEITPLLIGYVCNESPKSKLLWCCANNLKKNEFLSAVVTGFPQLLNQHGNESSHEVEQMLLVAPESKEWNPSKAHDKVLSSDKGGTDLSSTAAMYYIIEKASHAKDIARISSEHSFIS